MRPKTSKRSPVGGALGPVMVSLPPRPSTLTGVSPSQTIVSSPLVPSQMALPPGGVLPLLVAPSHVVVICVCDTCDGGQGREIVGDTAVGCETVVNVP